MSNIANRLANYIGNSGYTINSFAKYVGIDQANLSKMTKGKLTITPKTISKISSVCSELDTHWLLTGEGSMIKQPTTTISNNHITGDNNNVGNNIQVTNHAAHGEEQHVKPIVPKYLASQPNTDVYEVIKTDNGLKLEMLTTFPPYVDFDFYYQVRQDAMQPLYMQGDVLALAHTQGEDIIQGAAMVIDTRAFGFLLRRVYDRGDYYECKVINNNSAYETQSISKDNVIRLYRIVYSIRLGE